MSTGSMPALLDVRRIRELIDAHFPQIQSGGRRFIVEEVGQRSARVRMAADPRNTRPGGTISGPAMFALADFSVYVAIIATLGEAGSMP
jgi:acyl-coenzyme A thioesterase PaaI-like protein